MEKVKKIEVTTERIEHHFWCDECEEYLGCTDEYEDGYYEDLGEYEVKFYLNGWYELRKNLCPACKISFSDRIRDSLIDLGFKKR